tara:strand:+ start:491 stop:646 length:156 start_codon:yes stop_codon:yes gene_type:complete
MGIIGGLMIYLLRRTGGNDHFDFSLKCKDCGWHKGVLKCMNCEDRKKDKWR